MYPWLTAFTEGHYGTGRHWWLASSDELMNQLKALFAAIHLYIWALCCVKISLLLQYRRIFVATWLQRMSIIIICFSVSWNVAQSILVSFACSPASAFIPSLAPHCLDSLTIWYIAAGINITTDFIVFLLPIPLVNSLQLPIRQRVLLIMVFCLGFFTCIISIVRATKLEAVVKAGDPSYYGAPGAIWSMVELNCAVLCACLPTVRQLIGSWIPCLGLRTVREPSGYYVTSRSTPSRRRLSVFPVLRSKKSKLQVPGGGYSKGSAASEAVMTGSSKHDDRNIELDTTWANDLENDGALYHSNNISAWVSAEEPKSPVKAKVRPGEHKRDRSGSESRLIGSGVSTEQLRTNILVTRDVTVVEGRSTPSPQSQSFTGIAL
ncbi:putative integral membrane protein [Diaporthe ampelina]|uniref:Putative integral membrane protein n=1 Tax=Diaporthe ampelina TaxID=1214573 RepID=A0A0G2HR26_9PEZI|nr:putative integral membrane protein [Diaporthe ampelina]